MTICTKHSDPAVIAFGTAVTERKQGAHAGGAVPQLETCWTTLKSLGELLYVWPVVGALPLVRGSLLAHASVRQLVQGRVTVCGPAVGCKRRGTTVGYCLSHAMAPSSVGFQAVEISSGSRGLLRGLRGDPSSMPFSSQF